MRRCREISDPPNAYINLKKNIGNIKQGICVIIYKNKKRRAKS